MNFTSVHSKPVSLEAIKSWYHHECNVYDRLTGRQTFLCIQIFNVIGLVKFKNIYIKEIIGMLCLYSNKTQILIN